MNKPFHSILFLSTGRTGTKFLASILRDTVRAASVFHEAGERSRLINILSHASIANVIPDKLVQDAWKLAIEKQLKETQENKRYYIDANNHIYFLAVNHPELYPGLKVVHIVRDPRTYIRSHLNWSYSRVKSFLANYLTPYWQPTGSITGDMPRGEWLGLSKLERFAWIWNFKNAYINRLEGSSTPYLWVRFEDLFSSIDPGTTYQKILDFIGINYKEPVAEYFQRPINASKKTHIPEWTSWSTHQCRMVDHLCREGMTKYGYGNEPDWIEKVKLEGIGQ